MYYIVHPIGNNSEFGRVLQTVLRARLSSLSFRRKYCSNMREGIYVVNVPYK